LLREDMDVYSIPVSATALNPDADLEELL